MSVSRTKTSKGWAVKGQGPVKYFKSRERARAFARGSAATVFRKCIKETVEILRSLGATPNDVQDAFNRIRIQ